MEVAALGLRVDGVSSIDQATSSLGGFTKSATEAERAASSLTPSSAKSSKSLEQLGRSGSSAAGSMSSLSSVALRAGGILATAFSVSKVIQYADAWSDMQSRIGAAAGDMSGAAGSMERILQIANASYSPLSQTAEIYARNLSTLRDLGRTAAEAADFTESLNNMLVITATRGERAASVQNALSKAMAVGKLEADGLETVLANGGEVAQALARQLGTNVSSLRSFASQGKITGDVIATAVVGSLEDVRARAAEMPATMADAFVRVGNNLTAFVGTMDQATGASEALAAKIIELSDAALKMATSEEAIAGLLTWQGTLQAIGKDIVELDRLLSEFSGNAQEDASDISFSFAEMPANIRAMIQIATVEIASFIDAQMNGIQALAAAVKALPDGPTASVEAFNQVRGQRAELGRIRAESIAQILEERDAILKAGRDGANAYKDTTRSVLEFSGTVATAAKELSKEQKKEAARQAREAKSLIDNLQQQVFQIIKRTAVEKLAFDIKKDNIKLSETQLKQAEDLARQIDAAAIAERNKSAEIDRQNTMYQLQEGLISRQQQYDSELGTAGMGDRAAAQAKERIALEQAAQRELRDITHQHGQEMRAAETEDQRKHLQAMYEERLLLTQEAQAKELQSYDEFTQQKNALDQDWMAGAQSAFATYSEQATNLYAQTADMVTSTLDSVSEGIAQSATDAILKGEDFRSSMAAVGDAIIENILGSLIKMGVQLAINAAIGKAFGSAAVAASVGEAAAISAAWATPAAFVSLATFGANSAAAISGIAATTAMSQGLAVAGFQQGGYTGNMGVSDVAGVVHGREYVFDAAATSRIGVPTLEAIRSGRSVDGSGAIVSGQAGDSSMPAMSIPQNFVINGDPDKSTMAMIKKAAADGARMGYQQVANDISSGRGVVSKSLQQGFHVGRRKQ